MQLHAIKPHLHAMALRVVRNRAIGGKQRKLSVAASVLVKRLDHATPGFMLAVVLSLISPRYSTWRCTTSR